MSRAGVAAIVLACAVAAAGCTRLPDSGPVVEAEVAGSGTGTDAMAINPAGPVPGQGPTEIVKGFLDAMLATPIRTDVAAEFLTTTSRATWRPTSTITYLDASPPRVDGRPNQVSVSLEGAVRIDARGSWLGALDGSEAERTFRVVREGGEFRIAGPPDVLVVPQDWFTERFRQVSLYFFDPTAQILVPDPVFVPREVDLPSSLVRRLVTGPPDALAGFVRNEVPAGADPDLSVEVSSGGVATVDFTGDGLVQPSEADTTLLQAQLAWTLRQDPSVTGVRVLVNGVELDPDGPTTVTTGALFAPYAADASSLLYGLDDGVLVEGDPRSGLLPVGGPFGTPTVPMRAVSPDLDATRAAGVAEDGRSLWVGPVGADEAADDSLRRVWKGATSLVEPAWDFAGRVWSVDRRAEGAVVAYVPRVGERSELAVPGVTGEDVKDFLVSRDGSRLVAVVRRARGDQLVVSRLLQNPAGQVVRALPAQQVDVEDGQGLRIRDVAWLTPTTAVVLHPLGRNLFRVRSASLDGAPTSPDDLAVTVEGRVRGLVGSPDPRLDVYAVTGRQLLHLTGPRQNDIDLVETLEDLGYVG